MHLEVSGEELGVKIKGKKNNLFTRREIKQITLIVCQAERRGLAFLALGGSLEAKREQSADG